MRRKHAMPSGVKALYEDLVARGELPDIKGLKREFRKRGEQALSNPSQSGSYEQKTEKPVAITPAEYSGLQAAFDHLNAALFNGKLPDIFITYQRRAHSGGYFGANRFADRGSKIDQHEIALNPDGFVGRTDEFIVSILHHEMCHLWQHMFGQHKSSRGYHNREWAAKMQATGLMPSSTGMVGGKTTGVRMQHYIIDGGPFSQAFAALAATGWKLNLGSAAHAGKPKSPPSKVPFTCPSCGWNVWGKPDTAVFCKPCWITTGGELIELRAKDAPSAGANPPAPAEAQAVVQTTQPYDQTAELPPSARKRIRKRQAIKGPRDGDWVIMPDGRTVRLTSDGIREFSSWIGSRKKWPIDGVQDRRDPNRVDHPCFTTDYFDGKFYLNGNGSISYSGGNDFHDVSRRAELIDTERRSRGTSGRSR